MSRIALHWQILIAMLLGAAGGLGLNLFQSRKRPRSPRMPCLRESSPRQLPIP